MPRKKIAQHEPGVPVKGAAGAVVDKAPSKSASTSKVRAPRASAKAVTHKHKQTAIAVTSDQPAPAMSSGKPKPSNEDVAKLAYSYWETRQYCPGSPQEDWLRAERELGLR